MRSLAVFTKNMDDLDLGVAELKEKLKDFKLGRNSLGVVFAHAETDFEELGEKLREEFKFPIMGCSAMSLFSEQEGYAKEGISFHVFTADDCSFAAGMTAELTEDNYKAEIKRTFNKLKNDLGGWRPKVIITYAVKNPKIPGDELVNILDDASGGIPVFGGFCSDNFVFSECSVMLNSQQSRSGMVMVLIGGDVKPVIKGEFSVETVTDFDEIVTETRGNVVYKLGNKTVVEALRAAGFNLEAKDLMMQFVGSPFLVTFTSPGGDEIQVVRNLDGIDLENGAGIFLGNVPKGAHIQLAMFSRKDVAHSVAKAIQSAIVDVANEHKYEYTSAIITSCVSRLMTFTNDDMMDETKGYSAVIPRNIRFSGMYSYGEFCPIISKATGNVHNCFHNTTFSFIVL